jgi:hypothetical protein
LETQNTAATKHRSSYHTQQSAECDQILLSENENKTWDLKIIINQDQQHKNEAIQHFVKES